MALMVVLGCVRPDHENALSKKREAARGTALTLLVMEPTEREERVVAVDPDSATIKKTVESLKWSPITFVTLKRDAKNWMEASGSLSPEDGLSARYSENGVEHVSARAPKSLSEIVDLLQSYRSGDDRWRSSIEWQ